MALNIFKTKAYWWSVTKIGFFFVIIVTILQSFISFFKLDFSTFVEMNFRDGKWKFFLLSRFLGGMFYGMWMSYGKYRKTLKSKQ